MERNEIEKSILVQKNQVDKANGKLSELKNQADEISATQKENRDNLIELDSLSGNIAKKLGLDRNKFDLEGVESKIELEQHEIYEIEKRLYQFKPLDTIEYTNWEDYKTNVNLYIERHKIDMSIDPIHQMLTPEQYKELDEKYKKIFHQYKWDNLDYIFVGASGVLASLTDFLLVRIPNTIKIGKFAAKGSPITEWLKKYDTTAKAGQEDWFSTWARTLEKKCQVPYDAMSYESGGVGVQVDGMSGWTHRLQSLGHDPVLGFIFGILNIYRGTMSGFSYDSSTGMHDYFSGKVSSYIPGNAPSLIEATLKHMGHLISDVSTPMGLPAPFMTLIQGINIGKIGTEEKTVGEIARQMYACGYDFRHFLVSGITPAVIEIVLRAYIMLRHYCDHGEIKLFLASNPKYRSMLLSAHAIAAAGNIGKIALYQGNPLAINYAEWLALLRYLIPSIKYWLFEKNRKINNFYDQRWEILLENSQTLYNSKHIKSLDTVQLGL